MKPDVLVFYAGLVYLECTHKEYELSLPTWSPEIYNGAYLYLCNQNRYGRWGPEIGWYRPDGTPFPEEQVPSALKAWVLILT